MIKTKSMFRALCHGFNAAKAPKPFQTPVQSRLFFPPFAFAGGGGSGVGNGGKRNREETAAVPPAKARKTEEEEVVVLLDSDDEEEQQRQKIMRFAATRRVETSQQNTAPSKINEKTEGDDIAAAETTAPVSAASDEEAARNRIMAQAAATNAERGISSNSNNSLLAQLHAERLARRGAEPSTTTAAATTSKQNQTEQPGRDQTSSKFSILSYNLWFNEQTQIYARMQAISEIISTAVGNDLPDVLCFQEVTPLIYSILSGTPWWKRYTGRPTEREVGNASYFTVLLWKNTLDRSGNGGGSGSGKYASLPFENSRMGRDLKAIKLMTPQGLAICVATSHLESPTGRQQLFSETRQAQCKEALEVLDTMGNDVMYIGDMNWNEKNDGAVPLPSGW
jgi:hypothetical protein